MARKLDYGTESHRSPTVRTTCRRPGCTNDATEKNLHGLMQCQQHAEQEHLMECKAWLAREGIARHELTGSERMKALAAYRGRISKDDKPDPLDWARRILMRHSDGESISRLQQRMAETALD